MWLIVSYKQNRVKQRFVDFLKRPFEELTDSTLCSIWIKRTKHVLFVWFSSELKWVTRSRFELGHRVYASDPDWPSDPGITLRSNSFSCRARNIRRRKFTVHYSFQTGSIGSFGSNFGPDHLCSCQRKWPDFSSDLCTACLNMIL